MSLQFIRCEECSTLVKSLNEDGTINGVVPHQDWCSMSTGKLEQDARTKERRRYALLQAAATILSSGGGVSHCADLAEQLLTEIEKREKENDAA